MVPTETTVYIIDDDDDIRSSLSRALGKRGFQVATFDSAAAFLNVCDPEKPGCIILDQGMPGMTGLELQQELVTKRVDLPVIFITGHGGVPESVQAMKAGAIDFLEKPFRTDILVERIDAAFEGLFENRKASEKTRGARRKLASLTPREKEIVDMMVADPSKTSSKDLARSLDISPRTVEHHRARILEKLQIKSVVELIDLAIVANSS